MFEFAQKRFYRGDCVWQARPPPGWFTFSEERLTKLLGCGDPQGACSWHRYLIKNSFFLVVITKCGAAVATYFRMGKHTKGDSWKKLCFSPVFPAQQNHLQREQPCPSVVSLPASPEWRWMHPQPPAQPTAGSHSGATLFNTSFCFPSLLIRRDRQMKTATQTRMWQLPCRGS